MLNHKDERVIYIKDLLFAVLYQWRKVLIVALALALLLGTYRGIFLYGNRGNSAAAQETVADYNQQKQTLEVEITRLEDRIASYSTYITNSPFMAINPHSVYVAKANIYAEQSTATAFEGSSDLTNTLLSAYYNLLMQSKTLDTVATALDLEGMNMEGIVDVSRDKDANFLSVIIRQENAKNAEKALDIMLEAVQDAQAEIEQALGTHTISVIGRTLSLRNDTDLAALQDKRDEELFKLKETLKTRLKDQTALVAPDTQPISNKQILISAIKYAILGGVLGCFVVAFIICIAHLVRSKVYSRRTLEDQTGLTIFGCIPTGKKRCCIDRWLRKLEGRCTEATGQQYALIAARIGSLCGTDSALLISGAGDADDRVPLLKALEAAGCTVIASGDLLSSADTVKALGSCTGVVLMEQCGKSRYTAVRETADQAELAGKPILGCVLIDG